MNPIYPEQSNYERNRLGMDAGQGNTPRDATVKSDESLLGQLGRLHQLVDHFGTKLGRLGDVADKIDGPVPTATAQHLGQPLMNGIAGQVQIANNQLLELLAVLEAHTSRIDRHIG